MKVSKLSLTNYRGFDRLDINFEEDITVLYGENGFGKSSMLVAISRLLSNILPLMSYSREQPQSFLFRDIKHGNKFYDVALEIGLLNGQSIEYQDYKDVATPFSKQVHNRVKLTTYKERRIESVTDLSSKNPLSPENSLGVYYNVQRSNPIVPRTLSDKGFDDVAAAYSRALTGDRIELSKAIQLLLLLEFDSSKQAIISAIANSIKSILSEYRVSANHSGKLRIDKDKDNLDFTELSDGEKGVIAMVVDLARRLAIANPDKDDPIKEGSAIVLIDEIELHLHPGWQRMIIRRLMETFPKCQFIFTTHSPQVLGEVEARCIRCLYRDESTRQIKFFIPPRSIGLDSSEILEELMDVPRRNLEIEHKANTIYGLIGSEKYEEARLEIKHLEDEYGRIHEVVRLETALTFSEVENESADEED